MIPWPPGWPDEYCSTEDTDWACPSDSTSNTLTVYVRLPVTNAVRREETKEVKARLRHEHRSECQQAFNAPPRKSGRGKPPPRKWDTQRGAPRGKGRGRRKGR